MVIPGNELTVSNLNHLFTLYQESKIEEIPYAFSFLLKFEKFDKNVGAKIINIILTKIENSEIKTENVLTVLFNPYDKKLLSRLFGGDIKLFKKAYFIYLEAHKFRIYNREVFFGLLDIDYTFIKEYLNRLYGENTRISSRSHKFGYGFFWKRKDYKELITNIVDWFYEREKIQKSFMGRYLRNFFILEEKGNDNPDLIDKQNNLLKNLIIKKNKDSRLIKILFNIIYTFPGKRSLNFFDLLLQCNDSFETFKNLVFEPSVYGMTDNPMLRDKKRIEFFESLLPFLNTVHFLQHRQYIEQRISNVQSEIELRKRRKFIED